MPADDYPKQLSQWTEEQLSHELDPVDEMIGDVPSEETIELARQAFDRHVTRDYKRKMDLWCLDFYVGAAAYMMRTGEEINAYALPGSTKKAASKSRAGRSASCNGGSLDIASMLVGWYLRRNGSMFKSEEPFALESPLHALDSWRIQPANTPGNLQK